MADQPVAPLELLRIDAIDLAPAFRQIGVGGFHHDVLMVGLLAVDMAAPVETVADLAEQRHPIPPVTIGPENSLLPIPARSSVIKPACDLNTKWSCHVTKFSAGMFVSKT